MATTRQSILFDTTWVAGDKLHTGTFGARNEQQLRERLTYWWGRDCTDFEIIEIVKAT